MMPFPSAPATNVFPVATQGVSIEQILAAFPAYLKVVTELPDREIIQWNYPSRPSIEGYDKSIWYRLIDSPVDPSIGPVRFGNKTDLVFDTRYLTRSFADASQRDPRMMALHITIKTRLLIAFQGENLFANTVASTPINGIWVPPVPSPVTAPLTVKPMRIEEVQQATKDQGEEGTMSSAYRIYVPVVLNLTIN